MNTKRTKLDDQVSALAATGEFDSKKKARGYLEKTLAPLWRDVCNLPSEVDGETQLIEEQLGITSPMALLIHVFGRGVPGKSRKLPRLTAWNVADASTGIAPKALTRRHLQELTGLSQSQVIRALASLRGKRGHDERFFGEHLAVPMFVPTGVMMDVHVAKQRMLFEWAHYSYAKAHAKTCGLNDSVTNQQQAAHCDYAIGELKVSDPRPAALHQNDATRQAV